MAMIAAPLVAAHPHPLRTAAGNNCHGIGNRPAEHPDHQRRRAAECDRSDAEHAVRVGKARDQDRADQKMDRDRGRYDGYRPAMLFMQNIEEHGWSVVADPKTECCDGERRGNDLPSEEYRP
jgi:hypothetical protein